MVSPHRWHVLERARLRPAHTEPVGLLEVELALAQPLLRAPRLRPHDLGRLHALLGWPRLLELCR
eukprot:496461-Prymnesium_polylepis.1